MERPRDVISGVAVVAIGAAFLLVGRDLDVGTASRMGAGYFPMVLSALLIGLGLVITGLALRRPASEGSFGLVPWRGIVLVIGATVGFGLTLQGLGLGPVVLAVVLATASASRYASLRRSVPLAIGLAAFCAFLFIRLLGLPLPFVGPWFSVKHWAPASTSSPSAAPAPPAVR